jgi:N,N'-diacetyllegionaminate synthase
MSHVENLWNRIKSGNPFFIAEAGVNHLGSLELGERLIKEAAHAGAHAIKFQSYKAANLCTKDAPRFWDWEGELEEDGSQFDSYSHLDSFGEAEHAELKRMCDEYNIEFMSTPFDDEATDYLNRVGINAYKIASCDVTNHPLLKHVGSKKKIVMLSTGAADLQDIRDAVDVLEKAGTNKIVIMHCNLKYPTDPDQINLSMIKSIQEEFGEKYVYGLSDHTMTVETPAFSLMLGANVVEKHYTVDKTLDKSADHWLSVDPDQVKEIVRLMDLSHVMMGTSEVKECTESEERARMYARRSVVSLRPIKAGEVFTPDNIGCKRPGTGISPKMFDKILGASALQDVDDDTLLTMDDVNRDLGE